MKTSKELFETSAEHTLLAKRFHRLALERLAGERGWKPEATVLKNDDGREGLFLRFTGTDTIMVRAGRKRGFWGDTEYWLLHWVVS